MPAITTQPRTLKWALPKKTTSGARIQKQTRAPQSCKSKSASSSSSSVAQLKKKQPKTEMERLESELAFTYDTLATISVHFESLQLAYTSSKADLKKNFSATRLGPKEKELLAAYDDLGLQVVHLERKINTLESKLQKLRSQEENNNSTIASTVTTPASSSVSSLPSSSPASSTNTCFDVSPLTFQDASFNTMDEQIFFPTMDYTVPDCAFFENNDLWMANDLDYSPLFV